MKRLAAMFGLIVMGLSVPAYADGWRFIEPENMRYISYKSGSTSLVLTGLDNSCGSHNITVLADDPAHDRIAAILSMAFIARQKLNIWVICDGSSGRFGDIEME